MSGAGPCDLPRPFGSYTLEEWLGQGGSAKTYRGTRSPLGGAYVEAAIKVFDEDATFDPTEVVHQASIRHPNVVQVLDVVQEGSQTAVVLELVDGIDLLGACELRSPFSPAIAMEIGRCILRGLQAIHAVGLIHGDISSPNILLSKLGEVKISDFGVTRGVPLQRVQSVTLVFAGTPQYASPDQIRPGIVIDARADLFPVGILLYEMMTGRPLFHAGDSYACLLAVAQGDLHLALDPTFAQLDGIEPGLGAFVRRLLQGDREKRFPTARDALEAAEALDIRRPFPGEIGELVRDCLGSRPGPGASPAVKTFAAPTHVVVQSADIEAILAGATVSQTAMIVTPPPAPQPHPTPAATGRVYALLLLLLAVFMLARVLDERARDADALETVERTKLFEPPDKSPVPPIDEEDPLPPRPRKRAPRQTPRESDRVVTAPSPDWVWTVDADPEEQTPRSLVVEPVEPTPAQVSPFEIWTAGGDRPDDEMAAVPTEPDATPFHPLQPLLR